MPKPEIKAGQYWQLKNGFVVLVARRNEEADCWLVNRVDKDFNFIEGVGEDDKFFERELSPEEAKNIVKIRLEKSIADYKARAEKKVATLLSLDVKE